MASDGTWILALYAIEKDQSNLGYAGGLIWCISGAGLGVRSVVCMIILSERK